MKKATKARERGAVKATMAWAVAVKGRVNRYYIRGTKRDAEQEAREFRLSGVRAESVRVLIAPVGTAAGGKRR